MGIFDTQPSDSPLSVDVPPMAVYVARIKANADPTANPTWGSFRLEPRLKVLEISKGSSLSGPSHASLQFVPGAPLTADDEFIEDSVPLGQGDRVLIGIGRGSDIRYLFAGTVTQAHLVVSATNETETVHIRGPEWAWGQRRGSGSADPVYGQFRRESAADHLFFIHSEALTSRDSLVQFAAFKTVFNPDGRKNCTADQVQLASAAPSINGYCFDTTDREYSGASVVRFWTKLDAVKYLLCLYNDPLITGIDLPDFGILGLLLRPGAVDQVLRSVDVDAMPLWEALQRVLEPDYGFYIDPRPDGQNWRGFKIRFFKRGQDIDGSEADLWLNPFQTPIDRAAASLTRIEAAKDASKIANRVTVLGSKVCHVKLQYHGGLTPTLSAPEKKLALQHGWSHSVGDLFQFAGNVSGGTYKGVEWYNIDNAGQPTIDIWNQYHVTTGAKFAGFAEAFRLFTWNEGAQHSTTDISAAANPKYGNPAATGVTYNWFEPDLTGIADSADRPGVYCRCNRKLLDTAYADQGSPDGWRRVPPILYMAAASEASDAVISPWIEIRSHYRFDPERAAVWFTAPDLARWYPLQHTDHAANAATEDVRSFATLLVTGKLRLMIEACVPTDFGLEVVAERTADSGLAMIRKTVVRRPEDFSRMTVFADGVTSPLGLATDALDQTADAQLLAEQIRSVAQRQSVHASLQTAADWPEQSIGKMLTATKGRVIDLSDGTDSNGAQIVGVVLNAVAMSIEYVTESEAMKRRRSHSRHRARRLAKLFRAKVGPTMEMAQPMASFIGDQVSSVDS
jgi:hypothetical protein